MKKEVPILLAFFLSISFSCAKLYAQNNLAIAYESSGTVPDFLNICGDSDSTVVVVSLAGAIPAPRENISAAAHLFKGVEFVSLDVGGTTPGVTVDATDPNKPVFSLPNMSPIGLTSVRISFSIAANCEYVDTLTINDAAVVYDVWEFDYTMGGSNFNEMDANTEYRDAFAVPFFTAAVENIFGPARVGDCFSRDIVMNNSGLDGFVDTVYYENVQGAGIYVTALSVNGVSVPFTKQALMSGDTLISAVLDSAHFVFNTIGAGPGDGDGFFDPNETLRLTEDICVLSCPDSRSSTHSVSWGCKGRACNMATATDFVRIGEGAANAVFGLGGSVSSQDVGYCQTGVTVVTYTNNGVENDPGFGTMLNIAAGIGMGSTIPGTDSFPMQDNGFYITGVSIAGVNIPSAIYLNPLDSNSLFSSDPDGAGGLEDFDNDNFFDDLPLGESVEIVVTYEFDCSLAQEPGVDSTCANSFGSQMTSLISYTDACQDTITLLQQGYNSFSNSQVEFENFRDADAYTMQDTFFLLHTQERAIRFFDRACSGGEQLQVQIVLPQGMMPVLALTEMLQGFTSMPLVSNSTSNDTLTLIFDPSGLPFLNGEYELSLAFTADCTADIGPSEFPLEIAFYCPDCVCRHIWYCGDLPGPQIHALVPPCSFNCPEGLQTMSFDVNRTTFGFTDSTYTNPIDPAVANRKVAISCDSVEMKLVNIVGDTPVSDSIGVVITYNNIDDSPSPDETFLFGNGRLRITNGGSEYFCSFDPSALTVSSSGVTKTLRFDLDSCLVDLGLTLNPGDTVEFLGNFALNPDGPYLVDFRTVPNFRAYAYGIADGTEHACDNFGDIFTIAKNRTVFDYPSSLSHPRGCQETFLQYRLVTTNNNFSSYFGSEYRQAIKIDSITFVFDPNLLDAFSTFETEVMIQDHPVHGNNFFPVPGFDSTGSYVAHFDTLTLVPSLKTGQTVPFSFRIRAVPSCASELGSSQANNSFNLDPSIHYIDRYYASFIGDGSCADPIVETRDADITYTEPPTFSLASISNPNFLLAGDTAVWELQHCNTSFTADAGVSWLAIEDTTGSIEVVSIENIEDPLNPIPLVVVSYGPNGEHYFVFTDPLMRADGMSTLEQRCNTLRIKALVNRCGATNFAARAGWNCIMYATPNWTPALYPPCDDETVGLSVTTLDPFIDANVVEQPGSSIDLCDTATIAILVRNTDLGVAYDVSTEIILPLQGATLVPGSVEFAWPSGAAYQPAAADPAFIGPSARGMVYRYDNFALLNSYLNNNGLPAFNPVNPTDSNEFRIRYQFVTDCDFVSGSISYYNLKGLKGCGDSTNLESGETLPLNIQGTNPGFSKSFDIQFDEGSQLLPGTVADISITAINLSNTASDSATDKISLRIPLDVVYQPSSTVAIRPGGWNIGEPEKDTIGAFQYLLWCMPNGLQLDDSATVQLTLSSPDYDCSQDSIPVELITLTRNTVTCSTGGSCTVSAITSTNNGQLVNLPVQQQSLRYLPVEVSSQCAPGDQENVTIDGFLINNGDDVGSLPIPVDYYYDQNDNGRFDNGELLLANFTENGPLNNGDSISFSHSFTIDASQVCNLLAFIDSTGLGLCNVTNFSLGMPVLDNAGPDFSFCAEQPSVINTPIGTAACNAMTGYSFNWTAVPPATVSDLSATNIADPILDVSYNASSGDTLAYVLETTRPACAAISRDTVFVVFTGPLAQAVATPSPACAGDQVELTTGASYPRADWYEGGQLVGSGNQIFVNPTMSTTYRLVVEDAAGCVDSADLLVNVSTGPAIISQTADTDNCLGDIVSISIEIDQAIQNYTINTNGSYQNDGITGSNTLNFDAVYAGDTTYFEISIMGASASCAAIDSFTLFPCEADPCVEPSVSSLFTIEAHCGQSDGSVTIEMPDDPSNYSYTWLPNLGTGAGAGNIRNGLPFGGYTVQISRNGFSGCLAEVYVVVANADGPQASSISTPADCNTANGSALLSPMTYTYSWSDGGSGNNRSDLAAGIYFVTFSDPTFPSCENVLKVAIGEDKPLDANLLVNALPECGRANGSATVQVLGGSGNYSYAWPDGSIGDTHNNLTSGTYGVTITDNTSGCESIFHFILTDDIATATISLTDTMDISCAGVANGGLLYSVNYDPAFELPADTIITDGNSVYQNGQLPPGDYCLMIRDANDCVAAGVCFTIDEPEELELSVGLTPSCNGDGAIEVSLLGGQAPYQFDWEDISTGTEPEDRMNLSPGNYSLTITDALGCTAGGMMRIDNCGDCSPAIVSSLVLMEATCGKADGMAIVNVEGNVADYSYQWIPDIGTSTGAGNTRADLPAGGYLVRIIDLVDTNCVREVLVGLTSSDGPQASVLTTAANCGASDGTANLTPATHQYLWPDAQILNNRADLPAGAYYVTFTDPADPACENIILVEVASINGLTAGHLVNAEPDCNSANGSVTIQPGGGSGDYTYAWPDGSSITNGTRTDLASGVYTITITDNLAAACVLSYTFALDDNSSQANVSINSVSDANCFGGADGSVDFSVMYGLGIAMPVDTIITDGVELFENGQLAAGDYCLLIADANGCQAGSACFTIGVPDSLGLTFVVTPSCDFDGTIDVIASGGNPPYTYDWQDLPGADNEEDRDSLAYGFYSLVLTDADGCIADEDNIPIPMCPGVDTCDFFGPMDSVYLQAATCGGLADLCLDLPFDEAGDYVIQLDGAAYTGSVIGCNHDTLITYLYSQLFGAGDAGPYELTSWEVNGMLYQGAFQQMTDLLDSMLLWDPTGNWQLDTLDKTISGGDPNTTYSSMIIHATFYGITSTLGINYTFVPKSFGMQISEGRHEVVLSHAQNGCGDTLIAHVLCTNPDTIHIIIQIPDSDTICLDGSELAGPIDTIFNACPDGSFAGFEVLPDTSCVVFTGINPGEETACVTFCDSLGICDTTYVIITVLIPDDVVIDTIWIAQDSTYCIDTTTLSITGPITSIQNVCEDLSDGNVLFTIDEESLCVNYLGLVPGTDTACIELCNALGECDTINFYIHVLDSSLISSDFLACDTLYVSEQIEFCVDTTELPGHIVSIENACPSMSGVFVDFVVNPATFCVTYEGQDIGTDTACIVICDDFGLCDTTYLCVSVEEYFDPPIAVDDYDTTMIGMPVVVDIKTNDTLFGGVTDVFILFEPLYGTLGVPGNPDLINLDCSVTYNASDEFCERWDSFTYVVCTSTGCDTATVHIWIKCIDIVIFTAVSPNNDGVNDVFYIANILDFPENELAIYNRWGNLVYETKGYKNDWKGTWNGDQQVPDGTYYYVLTLKDESARVFRGYLQIHR